MSECYSATLDPIVQKMREERFTYGSKHEVEVTHINHPHSFYVRLSCLRHTMHSLHQKGLQIPDTEFYIDKLVVYYSETVGHYVRGRIQNIDSLFPGTIDVDYSIFAIDYGFVDKYITHNELYQPTEEATAVVPLAQHCRLNSCKPKRNNEFDVSAIEAMKRLVGKHSAKIVVRSKKAAIMKVDLTSHKGSKDIAKGLARNKFTKFVKNYSVIARNRESIGYSHRELKRGEILRVQVLKGQSTTEFYVVDELDREKYCNIDHMYCLYKFCCKQPPLDVQAALDGRPCAVLIRNPKRYERAIVLSIIPQYAMANVLLVDFSVTIYTCFEDLKPLGSKFSLVPLMPLYCTALQIDSLHFRDGVNCLYPGLFLEIEVLTPGSQYNVPHSVKIRSVLH